MARASSPPLEAVRGTAGWRRAGVIPTAGAGREEPEVAAGGSGPGKGRARGGSGRGWRREVDWMPGLGVGWGTGEGG